MKLVRAIALVSALAITACGGADTKVADRVEQASSDCEALVVEADWQSNGEDAATFCSCFTKLLSDEEPINAEAISQTLGAVYSEHLTSKDAYATIAKNMRADADGPDATQQAQSLKIGLKLTAQLAKKARKSVAAGDC